MDNIKTKDRYILEALKLFGERGYGSVKTTDLAKAVGVVPSALYKHYESKQKLYDTILEQSIQGYEEGMRLNKVDFDKQMEDKETLLNMSEEEQIKIAQSLLLRALHHEYAAAFRKLMLVEQFHNDELAKMYDYRYIDMPIEQHAVLFKLLMEEGKMKKADPQTLAIMYISPITVLVEVCDREPDKEEWALKMIENNVKEFNRNYRID